jgi:dienelactone hydrolase
MTAPDPVSIVVDGTTVEGDLAVPHDARALVVFAHGSGSSRKSPRNQQVAEHLRRAGLGTLLFDLLTAQEEREEQATRHLRFDIGLLASRLTSATEWVASQPRVAGRLPLGFFGASTGAAAALVAAADLGDRVGAVVSRGGRPDLAGDALPHVAAPTLLIVGGRDEAVLRLNQQAATLLRCPHRIEVVPGATHLFEEPGALEQVASLAAGWFHQHLAPTPSAGA